MSIKRLPGRDAAARRWSQARAAGRSRAATTSPSGPACFEKGKQSEVMVIALMYTAVDPGVRPSGGKGKA